MVEPAAEGAVFVEDALEFRRDAGDRFCRVRHQAEVRRVARGGVGTSLYALFDEHALIALAGGEDPSAKREAIDFAFDSDLGAGSPHFSDIERNADNDPVELRGYALERGFEGFGHKFGLRFHGESAGKDNIVAGETRNQRLEIRNQELGRQEPTPVASVVAGGKKRAASAAGAQRQGSHAQKQRMRHLPSSVDVYAPAPLEKLETASASEL